MSLKILSERCCTICSSQYREETHSCIVCFNKGQMQILSSQHINTTIAFVFGLKAQVVLLRTKHKTSKWEGELDTIDQKARSRRQQTQVFYSFQRVIFVKGQIRVLVVRGV